MLDGTRHNFILEYPCHSPSEKRWFLMSVTPLLGERGGAVVMHTDITNRKQIEKDQQLLARQLALRAVCFARIRTDPGERGSASRSQFRRLVCC